MRLYDTARRDIVDFEREGPRHALHVRDNSLRRCPSRSRSDLPGVRRVCSAGSGISGNDTRCVRNVTDVDDDILRKARELGVHYLDLAAEELARFDTSMAALGLLPAASEPRATSAIPEILSLVDAVLESGNAYRSGGAVYFDVSSFDRFGELSHLGAARDARPRSRARWEHPTTRTRTIPSTSCSGSRLRLTSRPGSRDGDREGPAGMSSALHWPSARSARRSTSTEVGAISCSPTTSARPPSPRR